MEEVAFAVVTKPYEEWEFYSDSASDVRSDLGSEGYFMPLSREEVR